MEDACSPAISFCMLRLIFDSRTRMSALGSIIILLFALIDGLSRKYCFTAVYWNSQYLLHSLLSDLWVFTFKQRSNFKVSRRFESFCYAFVSRYVDWLLSADMSIGFCQPICRLAFGLTWEVNLKSSAEAENEFWSRLICSLGNGEHSLIDVPKFYENFPHFWRNFWRKKRLWFRQNIMKSRERLSNFVPRTSFPKLFLLLNFASFLSQAVKTVTDVPWQFHFTETCKKTSAR